uniref:Uncharacterized protein n=1 Tax=Anopheles coluzzii TaxID=1518534 RepID=A0A8W7PDT6_ANOCL
MVRCLLQPHQHVQQRVLIFRITRPTSSAVIWRSCGTVVGPTGHGYVSRITAAPPVQLYAFPDRIHQVRRQMVVPHVREPYLRVGQVHRAGEEEPRTDRYIARAVRLEEAVNVLPDGGQPFEHLFQLGLLLLVLQLHREELAAQEAPQETFHRFHVVRRQDL